MNSFRSQPSFYGIFKFTVVAKAMHFAVVVKSCSPLISKLIEVNATNAACVIGAYRHVFAVLLIGCRAQIRPSVIGTAPINVVNLRVGPASGHIKPSEPVRKIVLVLDRNGAIPRTLHDEASNRSSVVSGFLPKIYKACKDASMRIIREKFAQKFCGKIGFSHDALQRLIGQRPPVDFRSLGALS